MALRTANVVWEGTLLEGKGRMAVQSGVLDAPYSHATRFKDEPGTNPEELIGAAHAGCFSMFLASQLTKAGFPPERIETKATVSLGKDERGPVIDLITLETEASVPGVDNDTFLKWVEKSKSDCPISRALEATPVEIIARLV